MYYLSNNIYITIYLSKIYITIYLSALDMSILSSRLNSKGLLISNTTILQNDISLVQLFIVLP